MVDRYRQHRAWPAMVGWTSGVDRIDMVPVPSHQGSVVSSYRRNGPSRHQAALLDKMRLGWAQGCSQRGVERSHGELLSRRDGKVLILVVRSFASSEYMGRAVRLHNRRAPLDR